jgi:hypothetical protein
MVTILTLSFVTRMLNALHNLYDTEYLLQVQTLYETIISEENGFLLSANHLKIITLLSQLSTLRNST